MGKPKLLDVYGTRASAMAAAKRKQKSGIYVAIVDKIAKGSFLGSEHFKYSVWYNKK